MNVYVVCRHETIDERPISTSILRVYTSIEAAYQYAETEAASYSYGGLAIAVYVYDGTTGEPARPVDGCILWHSVGRKTQCRGCGQDTDELLQELCADCHRNTIQKQG